ncbi:hypothetical protein IAG44_25795 [Streptomyces roseirectus]|uniref:Gram-positive cocci surface proteins LPxTG domain-containing protein n=1 Tax=Streptomyces roseirectus TaxID=2768066 RepID=A0A7H0II83_9ACTN|nr:hypothetical protein IAG44_25795 [Streptomyces roseirectus]
MRPCPSLARRLAGSVLGPALLCAPTFLATPAAALALDPGALPARPAEVPACATPGTRDFPLTARLRGGPESYEAGGGHGVWYLDLVNTTGRDCTGVHPVVVLVDSQRELRADQVRLDFYEGRHLHAVHFEETDADELVGPFGEDAGSAEDAGGTGHADHTEGTGTAEPPQPPGTPADGTAGTPAANPPFTGFSVPAHRTLTVKLRLALTTSAAANDVTAHAAVVQRQGDDGEWVGQSNPYRFTVEAAADSDTAQETGPSTEGAHELASTGLGPAVASAAVIAGGLLVAGAGLVAASRRR